MTRGLFFVGLSLAVSRLPGNAFSGRIAVAGFVSNQKEALLMVPITIYLPEAIDSRLRRHAQDKGLSSEVIIQQLLEQHLPQVSLNEDAEPRVCADAVLEKLWDAATKEQEDAGYDLLRALDENRGDSDRKLYPPEFKGISW